ncbi:MAG: insulinase family protein [Limnochordaceae bacterium]|nr:insulinase family protein [Limnochordaceae bacterium]
MRGSPGVRLAEQRVRDLVGDRLHVARFDSGFVVLTVPKPHFRQRYAVFAVRYGSIDSRFTPPGKDAPVDVPEGIAHFLEHKLFEKEKGDVFADFARLGASANAYTSYTLTAYLFSTVEHFEESLDLLLRFVQEPYFSEASVRKEQGIIEQELRMYEDDPTRVLLIDLMRALYHVHPVREEIGGTVESIRRIGVPDLYLCHSTFYRPSNAVLAVAGEVDPDAVARLAAERVPPGDDGQVVRRFDPQEPDGVRQVRIEAQLPVSRPRLALGIKDVPRRYYGRELVRRDLAISLALDAVLGRASQAFTELYESGLIDDAFSARYVSDTRFAHTVMGGETPDPDALEARLRAILDRAVDEGIDRDAFERLRRKEIGDFVASMDSPEMVANALVNLHFRGVTPQVYLEVLQELDHEEVTGIFREHVHPSRLAVSVVLPARSGNGGSGPGPERPSAEDGAVRP